jgi:hypothetical protein
MKCSGKERILPRHLLALLICCDTKENCFMLFHLRPRASFAGYPRSFWFLLRRTQAFCSGWKCFYRNLKKPFRARLVDREERGALAC